MSKINCSLIKDLLPLYIDELCSNESTEIIKNHLEVCEECNKEYSQLKKEPILKEVNDNSSELIKGVGNMFKKDKKRAILKTVAIFLVLITVVGIFAFLKVPLILYKGIYGGIYTACEIFESGDNSKSNYENDYFSLFINKNLGKYKAEKKGGTYIIDFGEGKNIVIYDENKGIPIATMDEHKEEFIGSLKYPVVYSFAKKGIENYGYSTEVAIPYNYKMLKDFISSEPPEIKLFGSFEDYTKACAYYSSMRIAVFPFSSNSHNIVSENESSVAIGWYTLSEDSSETYILYFQSKEDLSKIYAIKLAGFTNEEVKEIFKYAIIK